MSVHTTCMSFLTGLDVAANYLALKRKQRILIVSAERSSPFINFDQPESAMLLGDGAAAAVVTVTPEGEESRVAWVNTSSYGEGADLTYVPGCGSNRHPNDPESTPLDAMFDMDGLGVAGMVRSRYPGFLTDLLTHVPGNGRISMVIPHQANEYALKAAKRFGFEQERVGNTLQVLGNCVAASIPLTLYAAVRGGKVARGDNLLLLGVGAGLCLGGMVLVY